MTTIYGRFNPGPLIQRHREQSIRINFENFFNKMSASPIDWKKERITRSLKIEKGLKVNDRESRNIYNIIIGEFVKDQLNKKIRESKNPQRIYEILYNNYNNLFRSLWERASKSQLTIEDAFLDSLAPPFKDTTVFHDHVMLFKFDMDGSGSIK